MALSTLLFLWDIYDETTCLITFQSFLYILEWKCFWLTVYPQNSLELHIFKCETNVEAFISWSKTPSAWLCFCFSFLIFCSFPSGILLRGSLILFPGWGLISFWGDIEISLLKTQVLEIYSYKVLDLTHDIFVFWFCYFVTLLEQWCVRELYTVCKGKKL